MIRPEPEIVLGLFPKERQALLDLLSSLTTEEWNAPTVCTGWSVKDVAVHLLGDDIGVIKGRDGPILQAKDYENITWEEIVAFVEQHNRLWVEAGRRISTRLLMDFLRLTGEQIIAYYHTLDLYNLGQVVPWAGFEPAPVWLDVAREYTERWVHQQHIREAVSRPGLTEAAFLSSVLNTFMWALPYTLTNVDAAEGTGIQMNITGDAGSVWGVVKNEEVWELFKSAPARPDVTVTIDQDTAWRLFTKGLNKEEASARCQLSGDRSLAMKVLDTVSIIA
jgi:uncharacterized protein (TIGR03083 family)